MKIHSAFGLCLFAAACSEDSSLLDASPADASFSDATSGVDAAADVGPADAGEPDGGLPSNLSGNWYLTHVFEDRELVETEDLSEADFRVYVGPPEDRRLLLGSGQSDGTFLVENVPPGIADLVISFEDSYKLVISTGARNLDLGFHRIGRPTITYAGRNTRLVLIADGLEPWQNEDELAMFSPSASGDSTGMLYGATNIPLVGSTSIAVNMDCSYYCPTFERGDPVVFSQLRYFATPELKGYARGRTLNAEPFSILTGVTSTVTGTFMSLPEKQLRIDWPLREIDDAPEWLPKRAQRIEGELYLTPAPRYEELGDFDFGPTLALFAAEPRASTATVTVSYTNPTAASWTEFATVFHGVSVDYLATGATEPYPLSAYYRASVPLDSSGELAVRLVLSAPREPLIAGRDALRRVDGVGMEPLLSWTPPAVGTASGYQLIIYELALFEEYTFPFTAAVLFTDIPQIQVPPGILEAGKEYVLSITAISNGRPQVSTVIWRHGPEFAAATTLTEIFVP